MGIHFSCIVEEQFIVWLCEQKPDKNSQNKAIENLSHLVLKYTQQSVVLYYFTHSHLQLMYKFIHEVNFSQVSGTFSEETSKDIKM